MTVMHRVQNVFAKGTTGYIFFCPGCGMAHAFSTEGHTINWQFNGDMDRPTVTPSLLIEGEKRCHLHVTDGHIQFLDDCDHAFKGKTVPLPDLDADDEQMRFEIGYYRDLIDG